MSTPRSRLNRDRVLDAAVALADREGMDALTVRRLAEDLGVHPTSLYNHVASKEAVLDGVVERLFDAVPDRDVPDWQAWLRALAGDLRSMARAHPGAFMVLTRRPAETPAAYRSAERGIAAFRADGFALVDAVLAVRAASLALLGLALNECPPMGDWVEPAADDPRLAGFPGLEEAAAVPDEPDRHWELLVDALVTGLARRPSQQRAQQRRHQR